MPQNIKNATAKPFKFSYDMKETESHEINAELLGESILSLSRAIRYADKIVNGESSNLSVQVKAHSEGSFVVEFVSYFNEGGIDVLDILGITTLGTVATGTVFGVMERINSQKITAKVKKGKSGNAVISLDDGSEVECSDDIAKIVVNQDFRKEIDKVIKSPLAGKEGARAIFKDEKDNAIREIAADTAQSYRSLPAKTLDEVEEDTKQVTIHFSQVNFDGPTGWKVKLPNGDVVSARMRDEAFRNRINQGYEQFSKTYPCIVKLLTVVTTKADSTVKPRYYIEEVIRQVTN